MNKKFKFWCKGTSPNENFQKPGWWTFPFYILEKRYRGLEIFNCPHFEVCQWTGLLDKDGREIYEGDILEIPESENHHGLGNNVIVTWCEYEWALAEKTGVVLAHSSYPIYLSNRTKVIGNKFENPELLAK